MSFDVFILKKSYGRFSISAILIILIACGQKAGDDEIIARVGSATLNRRMLDERIEWEGMRSERESDFVDRWVNRELLYQEAKRSGLDKSEDLVWELELVEKEYLINKLLERTYAKRVQITEEEISSYYEKNKDLFNVNEDQVRILHILTKTKEEASLALQEIRAGKSFESVARERSSGIFRERGGDMGFIKKADVINEVARYAFRLQEGKESNVFSSSHGFHIVKVVKKLKKGDAKDLNDVRNGILQQLRVRKERSVYYDLIFQLQNKTEVSVSVPENHKEEGDTLGVDVEQQVRKE